MQADALYQRIVAHEAAVEDAEATGKSVPEFDPSAAIRAEQAKLAQRRRETGPTIAIEQQQQQQQQQQLEVEPNDQVRAVWDKKLADLPEEDRAVEEAALRADLQSRVALARAAEAILEAGKKKKEEERRRREEARRADAEARGEYAPAMTGGKTETKTETGNKMVWQQLMDRWRGQ